MNTPYARYDDSRPGQFTRTSSLADLAYQEVPVTLVDSPDRGALVTALEAAGVPLEILRTGIQVEGLDAARVGAIAASAGIALSALTDRGPALEEIFLEYVNGTRPPRLLTDEPQPEVPIETEEQPEVTTASDSEADTPVGASADEEGANR